MLWTVPACMVLVFRTENCQQLLIKNAA